MKMLLGWLCLCVGVVGLLVLSDAERMRFAEQQAVRDAEQQDRFDRFILWAADEGLMPQAPERLKKPAPLDDSPIF